MKLQLGVFVAAALFSSIPAFARQAAPQGPHPKNKEELAALQKVQAAQQTGDPDQELAAINNVLENFTNTDYKSMLISMGLQAAEQKNDVALVKTWSDRAIQQDPQSIEARVVLAETVARHTRENDLDKADSLQTVRTNANKALDILKTQEQPPAGIQAAQWPQAKQQLTAEADDALGQADGLDKKYPEAVADFKAGLAANPSNSVLKVRLAKAYNDNKQFDDAIKECDEILADSSAPASVKQFAQQQKDAATKMKGAAK